MRSPPPLVPSSVVAVVAPSGPAPRGELFTGLAWLRTRYRLRVAPAILARDGYLAGDDDTRAGALARAMRDPAVAAIYCARGGYGAMRIVDALPWDDFARAPKWIVGFSDVTTLHVAAQAAGVCSIHAPNATGLGRGPTPLERLALLDALEGRPAAPWGGLRVVHAGAPAEGAVFGGNLALLHAMAAGGRLVVPDGAILFFEDVTERPYRVDRTLTSLRLGGHLARASAIVFGDFSECEPGPDGTTIDDVLAGATRALGVPVVAAAPFGHGARNRPFVLGRRARLAGDTLSFA